VKLLDQELRLCIIKDLFDLVLGKRRRTMEHNTNQLREKLIGHYQRKADGMKEEAIRARCRVEIYEEVMRELERTCYTCGYIAWSEDLLAEHIEKHCPVKAKQGT